MNEDLEPKNTLDHWKTYIDGLEPEVVYSKAESANSVTFVRSLKKDGMSAKDIRGVFELFVRRIVANDDLPPAGGYYDLRKMVDELGLDGE
jgi:hypothetical protein